MVLQQEPQQAQIWGWTDDTDNDITVTLDCVKGYHGHYGASLVRNHMLMFQFVQEVFSRSSNFEQCFSAFRLVSQKDTKTINELQNNDCLLKQN